MPGEFSSPLGDSVLYQVSLLQKELTDDVSERYIANPLADSEDRGRDDRVFFGGEFTTWTFTWEPYICLYPMLLGELYMVARDDVYFPIKD